MAIIHRYSELALFLILNIFLSIPGLFFFGDVPIISGTDRTEAFFTLALPISFVKLGIFGILYRQKNLKYIRKFLNTFITDKKFFGIVILSAILLDIVVSVFFPQRYNLFNNSNFINCMNYGFLNTLLKKIGFICLLSGVLTSYLVFWGLQKYKKLKTRFFPKKHLSGLNTVAEKKLSLPSTYIVLTYLLYFCFNLECFTQQINGWIITLIYFFLFCFISAFEICMGFLIFAINYTKMQTKQKKKIILTIAKIGQAVGMIIYLYGLGLGLGLGTDTDGLTDAPE